MPLYDTSKLLDLTTPMHKFSENSVGIKEKTILIYGLNIKKTIKPRYAI